MGRQIYGYSEEQITEIMKGQNCQYDFRCLKEGLENIKFNRPFEGRNIFECQCEKPQACPYAHSYGYCYICKCPLLNHIDISRQLEM